MSQSALPAQEEFEPLTPQAVTSAVRATFVAQCAGVLAILFLSNGMMMLYLLSLGMSESRMLLLLAGAQVTRALTLVPIAHASDRFGIKRLGVPGHAVTCAGLGLILLAGFFTGDTAFYIAMAGIVVFGVSWAILDAGWFALLSGFVSAQERPKYFGKLRSTWMLTSIAFAFVSAWVLGKNAPVWVFQAMIVFVMLMQAVRFYFYSRKIPERVPRAEGGQTLLSAVVGILRCKDFAPFCAYSFLLVLFTAGGLALFGLIEKTFMNLGDGTTVTLSTLTMVGQLVGFMAAGHVVHKLGTKPAFVIAHVGFACVLVLFPLRGIFGGAVVWLGVLHTVLGLIISCSSVALTTELFSVMPAKRRSLSTAIQLTFTGVGGALSTMIPAWCLKLGFFKESWVIAGGNVSAYDAVLLAFGFLTLMMTVSLSLVPSVIGKNEGSSE